MKKKLCIILLMSFSFSCDKKITFNEEINQETSIRNLTDGNHPIAQMLFLPGYNEYEIKETNEYFILQDDILFDKDGSLKSNKSGTGAKEAHYISNSGITNFTRIKYKINSTVPSDGGDLDWYNAVLTAAQAWNDIPLFGITFVEDNSNWDILIEGEPTFGSFEFGYGTYPSEVGGGRPGNKIWVNTNPLVHLTELQKIRTVAHEFGHCLGFMHTSDRDRDAEEKIEQGEIPFSSLIPGTPILENDDPLSVMRGGATGLEWTGFTSFDTLAAQTVFPDNEFDLLLFPNSRSTYISREDMTITWDPSLYPNEINVRLEVLKNGVFDRVVRPSTPNDGGYTFETPYVSPSEAGKYIWQIRILPTGNMSLQADISHNSFALRED